MHHDDAAAAMAALDALDARLAAAGLPRPTWTPPVDHAEVEAAEATLQCRLPPSYVAFVTTRGTFSLSGALTGRGEGNDTVLYPPRVAAEKTLALRDELAAAGDTDSQEILNDGVVLVGDPDGEYFHVFVLSQSGERGELPSRPWDSSDPANSDPWNEGEGDFKSLIEAIVTHALRT